MKKEPPFEIPAITNQKEALFLYLGLDSGCKRDWDSVNEVEESDLTDDEKMIATSARAFEHHNVRYYVAHVSSKMQGEAPIAFNSNLWTIKKVHTSASWPPINEPNQFPRTMRLAHGYNYLNNELNSMWLDGLSVAHQLLEHHENEHGNDTYYQDSFGRDYIATLADPRIGADVGIVYDEVADPAHSHLPRKEQQSWQAFEEARLGLKQAPRGSIALLHDNERWHIRIHAGGGYVSDCKTMRSTGPKPNAREIQECVLSFEAYLARQQARKEREILRNFSRLRELNLQPGMTIQDVVVPYNGKGCAMTFKIKSISEAGFISLIDGRLRGSPKRFDTTIAACGITNAQVRIAPPQKAAFAAMTAALY